MNESYSVALPPVLSLQVAERVGMAVTFPGIAVGAALYLVVRRA